MQSKTSFFNPTLFRKNLARFWPLWGGASALGALMPLAVLAEMLQNGVRSWVGEGLEVTQMYYLGLAYFVPVISLFYAALCALAVWHYLYNARSVGLYHSLPITRKGLFVTNFLSGMAMMLIPYVVVGGLAVLISLGTGLFEPVGVAVTVLGVLGESFFYFASASLVVFITGNPFAFAAFYFIFHFLAAGAEWLLSELMTEFYYGVEQAYRGVVEFLSPTLYLMRKLHPIVSYEETVTDSSWIGYRHIESVTLLNGHLIAVYALVGVVLLAGAWLLYQRRRSESAGDVVAVGWMKPVFRYGVALCASLTGGVLLYTLFKDAVQRSSTAEILPMTVCMVIAGVVGYYIASMLLAKSLKVFRGSWKGALATVIASAAVCLFIAADPFGVESWVPDAGEVQDVELYVYGHYSYGRSLSAPTSDPATIQKLLDLHQFIVEEEDLLEYQFFQNLSDDRYSNVSLYLYYDLSNGKSVSRRYQLPASADQSEALRLAQELVSDPVIQEANIFGDISETRNVTSARLTGGYVGDLYDTRTQKINGLDLTLEQAKEVEAAIRRDIQAGHFGKTVFMTDYKQYTESACYGDIQLNYNVTRQYDDQTVSERGWTISLSISTYCTETLKALEDIGAVDSTHKYLTEAQTNAMQEQRIGPWSDRDSDSYGYVYDDDLLGETVYFPDGASVTVEEIS